MIGGTNASITGAKAGIITGNGYGFGLIISGNMYVIVPAFLPGRTLKSFAGQIIARRSEGDIGTATNLSFNFSQNPIGQYYAFNISLGSGWTATFTEVMFQMDGNWTIE